ncbi:TetR/AcrR family transcriptional regulator [Kutzneria sp. NPDC052558]|uniref:TetR/AcrR family transcriptional regulator n=1 Tax=Kutzneria sp. NPDC052558 TaxID=3364121 RepID=UPI0037CABC21
MSKGGTGWDGDRTRARLVESAEQLFAERGVDSVSIREVNRHAGLAPSAVHYHFGSKQTLLDAVIGRLGTAVNEAIAVEAKALLDRAEPPTSRELVDLAATPLLAAVTADPVRGPRWLKVVSTLTWRDSSRIWPEMREMQVRLLSRAYPDVPDGDRLLRFAIAFATLTQVLAMAPADDDASRERYVGACLDFVTTGLDGAMARCS